MRREKGKEKKGGKEEQRNPLVGEGTTIISAFRSRKKKGGEEKS